MNKRVIFKKAIIPMAMIFFLGLIILGDIRTLNEVDRVVDEYNSKAVAQCNLLHESVAGALDDKADGFVLDGKFLHDLSWSNQPAPIWLRGFVSSGGLLEESDFIISSDGQYMFQIESAKGALVRMWEEESIGRKTGSMMLSCLHKTEMFEGAVEDAK